MPVFLSAYHCQVSVHCGVGLLVTISRFYLASRCLRCLKRPRELSHRRVSNRFISGGEQKIVGTKVCQEMYEVTQLI